MEEEIVVIIFEYNLLHAIEQFLEDYLGNTNIEQTLHFLDQDTETHVCGMIFPSTHIR